MLLYRMGYVVFGELLGSAWNGNLWWVLPFSHIAEHRTFEALSACVFSIFKFKGACPTQSVHNYGFTTNVWEWRTCLYSIEIRTMPQYNNIWSYYDINIIYYITLLCVIYWTFQGAPNDQWKSQLAGTDESAAGCFPQILILPLTKEFSHWSCFPIVGIRQCLGLAQPIWRDHMWLAHFGAPCGVRGPTGFANNIYQQEARNSDYSTVYMFSVVGVSRVSINNWCVCVLTPVSKVLPGNFYRRFH